MSKANFLIRISGLTGDEINKLIFEESLELYSKCNILRKKVDNINKDITDLIYEKVNETEEDGKEIYISLKRDIFNNRIKKVKLYNLNLVHEEIKKKIEIWLSLIDELNYINKKLEYTFIDEIKDKRNNLRACINKEEFIKGVQLSNEGLYYRLLEYLKYDQEIIRLPRKLRNTEVSLLNYVSRMVYKPTPFSTFTGLSYGKVIEGKSNLNINTSNSFSFCQINITYISYIEANLLKIQNIKKRAFFSMNSTLSTKDDYLILINRVFQEKNGGFEKEKIVKIKSNEVLEAIEALFAEKSIVIYDELNSTIKNLLNCEDAEIYNYIMALERIGFIKSFLVYPNQHKDYLKKLCESLQEINDENAVKSYENLLKLLEIESKFGNANHIQRNLYLKGIKLYLEDIYKILDLKFTIENKSLIFEDVEYINTKASINVQDYKCYEENLKLVQKFMRLFDDSIIQKIALRIIFFNNLDRNDEISLIDFYIIFSKYNKSNLWKEIQKDESYQLIKKLRYEFYDYLDEKIGENNEVLELDEKWINEFIIRYPKELFESTDYSFYLQVIKDGGENSIILNKFGPGLFKHYSRYCNMFSSRDIDHEFVKNIKEQYIRLEEKREDVIFADLNAVLGFNVNIHPVMLRNEITYPGCCPNVESNQIAVEKLSVFYDLCCDRVKIKYNDKTIEIVPLGFLFPMLGPEMYKFLTSFCESNGTQFSFWNKYHVESKRKGFYSYPRMVLGKVVLDRKTWTVPKNYLRFDNLDMRTFFENIELIDKANMDREVFIKVSTLLDTFKEEYVNSDFDTWIEEVKNTKLRKPQYINFNSYLYQEAAKKLFDKANEMVMFQEVLPNPNNKENNAKNTFELLVDIN